MTPLEEIKSALKNEGYLCNPRCASVIYLARQMQKPILIEGPAGVGKTEVAKAVSRWLGLELIRLQCYEGLDESKAIYEWDYKRQLLHIQSRQAAEANPEEGLFSARFLLKRPLLQSITSPQQTLLLIDEVDKSDPEFEALLLEILSDFQVSVPEMGTLRAQHIPIVMLTSNQTRVLSEALKRRCLYLYLDYPLFPEEMEIVRLKLPQVEETLTAQAVRVVQHLRKLDLQKPPSIAETLDWVQALWLLGVQKIDGSVVEDTLHVLLKDRDDMTIASNNLRTISMKVRSNA
ncbi:MAG: AAA family ATPase [Bacillota bacterium]